MLKYTLKKSGICIPAVPVNMTMERLTHLVREMNLGIVDKIFMSTKKETSIRTAFVHFKCWSSYSSDISKALHEKGEVYIFYAFPNYIHVSLMH